MNSAKFSCWIFYLTNQESKYYIKLFNYTIVKKHMNIDLRFKNNQNKISYLLQIRNFTCV